MSSNLGGALSCFLAHDIPGLSCTCLAQLWNQLFLQASLGSLVGSCLYPLAAFSRVGNSLPLLGFWYPVPGCHHALFTSCLGSCPRLPLRCDALFTPLGQHGSYCQQGCLLTELFGMGRGCSLVLMLYMFLHQKLLIKGQFSSFRAFWKTGK